MFKLNGPIRHIMSAFNDGGDTGGGSSDSGGETPTPAPTPNNMPPQRQTGSNDGKTTDGDDGGEEQAPKWERSEADYQREIEQLRRENANRRVANKETLQQVAAALGIDTGDGTPAPTVESLTATLGERDTELETARAEHAQLAREYAAYRLAATEGANPTALLDSVAFTRSLEAIDPTDTKAVQQAIKTAVENNPSLKTPPAGAPSNTTDMTPGGHGHRQADTAGLDLAQIIAADYARQTQ